MYLLTSIPTYPFQVEVYTSSHLSRGGAHHGQVASHRAHIYIQKIVDVIQTQDLHIVRQQC